MRTMLTTAAAALALLGTAAAQDMRKGDTDGDGRLSRAEARAAAEARFAKVDENRDGFISEIERDAAKAAAEERRAEREANRETRRRGRRGERGERGGDRWSRVDTNDDGVVSEAEATDQALARFDKLDANADGFVTEDEVRAAMRSRREARGQRQGGRR